MRREEPEKKNEKKSTLTLKLFKKRPRATATNRAACTANIFRKCIPRDVLLVLTNRQLSLVLQTDPCGTDLRVGDV